MVKDRRSELAVEKRRYLLNLSGLLINIVGIFSLFFILILLLLDHFEERGIIALALLIPTTLLGWLMVIALFSWFTFLQQKGIHYYAPMRNINHLKRLNRSLAHFNSIALLFLIPLLLITIV